jgi:hypothetical protein
MTHLEIVLTVCSSVMTASTVVCARWGLNANVRVLGLERKVKTLTKDVGRYQAMAYDLAAQRDEALAAPLRLDAKTVGLIRLATSNPERNEAASSALVVCERLKKRLG